MEKKKVGLALGGGASRGLAHIGVLEVLKKERVPIDMIAGTSTGAIIGALCAQGKDVSVIRELAFDLSHRRFVSFVDIALSRNGLIQGRNINRLLETILGSQIKFSDLKTPFACIATDIMTGEEVVLNQGLLLDSVRASISIPVIFSVAKVNGRYLVDGQLVNPVPVDILREMGADFIIAVNVIPNFKAGIRQTKILKGPTILDVIMNSMDIANTLLVRHSLEGADIIIEPDVRHIGTRDFHRVEECIRQGKKATEEAIPKIRNQLED
ncbi:patatin-like phospholipase family protein [Chloroflexota bacterium]